MKSQLEDGALTICSASGGFTNAPIRSSETTDANMLSDILEKQGRLSEAEAVCRETLVMRKKVLSPNLAWFLATSAEAGLRNGAMAVNFAEKAVALTQRSNAEMLDTLAAS